MDSLIDTLITAQRGFPRVIEVNNDSEMTSQVFIDWYEAHNIRIAYLQLGTPNQNKYIERFDPTFREEVLNPRLFSN